MKRSRLFLGATTVVLAVAGIAATKAARLYAQTTYYYCTTTSTTSHLCLPLMTAACGGSSNVKCTLQVPGLGTHLYTIYKDGDNTGAIPCGSGNCTQSAFKPQ